MSSIDKTDTTDRNGTDTKSRLLDVAEELFASQGISATSLRNITSEADANLASVNYHFGSKEELIRAVFARRTEPINEERLRMLSAARDEAGSGLPTVESIVEAFVAPVMRVKFDDPQKQNMFLRLLGRVHSESEETQRLIFSQFEHVASAFMPLLKRALHEMTEAEFVWRVKFMIGAMAGGLMPMSGIRPFEELNRRATDSEAVLANLIPFIAAGLRAPVPSGREA